MTETGIIIALVSALLAVVIGLFIGRAARGNGRQFSELREAVFRTEGKLQQFSQGQETRWNTFDESVSRQTSEANKTINSLQEKIGKILEAHRNLEKLDSRVVDLQNLLSNKQSAGAFGEVQLENLVRQTLPPHAYTFQKTLSNGKRVDCLIDIPHPPGPISIDSKFPVSSYRKYLAAKTDAELLEASKGLEKATKGHVRDIAERYIIPEQTCDWAVMFLPSENIFAELHAKFPNTVERALDLKVAIASPSTLMALLNTVQGILRDAKFRDSADLIQQELGTLLRDIERLSKRTENLKGHFEKAQKDINEIGTSADKITRRADRIREVDLGDESDDQRHISEQEGAGLENGASYDESSP